MKRVLVLASHHRMAEGLKDSLLFVSNTEMEVVALSAYVDNQPIEDAVKQLMGGFAPEDEVVILTDMTSGSVNQKFFPYVSHPHTHLVSGMNLPLAFTIAMEDTDDYISAERMREIVEESRAKMKYVNDLASEGDDEDE